MNEPNLTPEEELPAADEPQLLDERSDAERERDEYKEGWMRAKADFLNYKKGEGERIGYEVRRQLDGLFQDILRVLDSFDIALTAVEPGSSAEKGMRMIQAQLLDALGKQGFQVIAVSPGDEFDPRTCEALGSVPSEYPPDSIAQVVQKGYQWNALVYRPARVHLSAPKS